MKIDITQSSIDWTCVLTTGKWTGSFSISGSDRWAPPGGASQIYSFNATFTLKTARYL